MAKAQLVFINRSAGTGTGGAPSATYVSYVLDEGDISLPTDGRFKTCLVFPMGEDIFLAVGANPDPNVEEQQILVPTGSSYEVAVGVGQRFAVKASGTNAGTGAGGGGGGGGTADTVKIDATQNTIKIDGTANTVKVAGTVPVSGPLTDAQLRATALPVSGPVTDTQLRATPLPVSGTVGISGNVNTGGLTDAQLRATAVPVSGPVTDAQLRATALPVSGPITNAQLRAAPVDVAIKTAVWRPLPDSIDQSGTITTADTWQIVVPRDPTRTEFTLQLLSDNAELWLTTSWREGLVAGQPGTWRLQTGENYWAKGCNEIRVLSSTAGVIYSAEEAF